MVNQGLAPFARNVRQQAVLALPGINVAITVGGPVTAQRIFGMRASYINALLIQSHGVIVANCTSCQAALAAGHPLPFPQCRRLTGHFGGACGNCKWPDHAARCSVRDQDSELSGDDGDDEP
jgi:Protein of unknown function (DUF3716)